MARYQVQSPDGQMHVIEGPDGATPEQVMAAAQANIPQAKAAAPSLMDRLATAGKQFVAGVQDPVGKNAVLGAVRGAAGIGATIMQPFQALADKLGGTTGTNQDTRAGIDNGLQSLGADPNSLGFKNGKLAAEIAGTSGVGGALGAGARVLGAAPKVVNALSSAGFTTGEAAAPNLLARAGDLALRSGAGAVTGAATTGLIDPDSAGTGAVVGAALPPALKALGSIAAPIGRVAGNALTGGAVSSEVQALAQRAKALGIDLPADRIANSKPLNALASSLNYVPLSGRQAVESRMQDQLNTAVSRTFGQDSPNVTMALRKAQGELGGKFESTLTNNTVKVDPQFANEMAEASNKAVRELAPDQAAIIGKQVDDIMSKAGTGEIDGQAAYNIKKTLDRIGNRNSSEAHYAIDLKKALMGALDRSLGPDASAAFATTRKQYGNMLDLQKFAQNGAEGDISIGRLANMKNIGNKDLQELADISAQFLKSRESPHGAAQRVGAGALLTMGGHAFGGPVGGAVALGGGAALGRATNMALDSNIARNMLMTGAPGTEAELNQLGNALYRGAPRSVQSGNQR